MKKLIKLGFLIAVILMTTSKLHAQINIDVSIQANIAPPPIPEYDQPPCPEDDYLWQPGYWAYDPDAADYYWVPGVWVAPPTVGYLWTPCYWGYEGSVYVYHPGYWGEHVGFYGGINYGGGFFGIGFAGGGWQGDHFRYNTAVVNVNTTVIHNTYVDRTVINNTTIVNNRVSYNGGTGGVTAKPRPEEVQAMQEKHIPPTTEQASHQQTARADRSQFAKANNGQPATVAINKVNGDRVTSKGTANTPPATDNKSTPAVQPAQPQRDQQRAQPNNVTPANKPDAQQPAQPQKPVQPQPAQDNRQPNNAVPANKPDVQQPVQPQKAVQPQVAQPKQQRSQTQHTRTRSKSHTAKPQPKKQVN